MLSNCKLHTTELGALRIKKNLGIDVDDVVAWCEKRIKECEVIKQGKNYYAIDDNYTADLSAHCHANQTVQPLLFYILSGKDQSKIKV